MWNVSHFKCENRFLSGNWNWVAYFVLCVVEQSLFIRKDETEMEMELREKRWPGKRTSRRVHIFQWVSKTLSSQWSWCALITCGKLIFFVPVVLLFLLQMVFHLLFKRSILSTLYYRFLSRSLDTKKKRKRESDRKGFRYIHTHVYTLTKAQLLKTAQTNNPFCWLWMYAMNNERFSVLQRLFQWLHPATIVIKSHVNSISFFSTQNSNSIEFHILIRWVCGIRCSYMLFTVTLLGFFLNGIKGNLCTLLVFSIFIRYAIRFFVFGSW